MRLVRLRAGRGRIARFRQAAIKPVAVAIKVGLRRLLSFGLGIELVVGGLFHCGTFVLTRRTRRCRGGKTFVLVGNIHAYQGARRTVGHALYGNVGIFDGSRRRYHSGLRQSGCRNDGPGGKNGAENRSLEHDYLLTLSAPIRCANRSSGEPGRSPGGSVGTGLLARPDKRRRLLMAWSVCFCREREASDCAPGACPCCGSCRWRHFGRRCC